MDAAHNGALSPKHVPASSALSNASGSLAMPRTPENKHGSLALVVEPRLIGISSTMENSSDKPQKHLPVKCATSKEPNNVASRKLHPDSRLARISRGSVNEEQKYILNAQLDDIQKTDPKVESAVVGDSEGCSNVIQECTIPALVDDSSVHVCKFIALVVFTTLDKSTSTTAAFLESPSCTQLTEYIWTATNFLTAERYWKGGLSSPAIFRTIIYLLRMFSCPRDNVAFETMKNTFAFFTVLGVKHHMDGRLNCTLFCRQLGTPNFVVLERLAMQIVDYDMLVQRGDWTDCGSRLRVYIGALPEKESRERVGKWLSTMELCPLPSIGLKRSSCVTNEARAEVLLEALGVPERAVLGKERIIGPQLQDNVQRWMQGVEEARREELVLQQRPISALGDEDGVLPRRLAPSWPPTFGATTSIWANNNP